MSAPNRSRLQTALCRRRPALQTPTPVVRAQDGMQYKPQGTSGCVMMCAGMQEAMSWERKQGGLAGKGKVVQLPRKDVQGRAAPNQRRLQLPQQLASSACTFAPAASQSIPSPPGQCSPSRGEHQCEWLLGRLPAAAHSRAAGGSAPAAHPPPAAPPQTARAPGWGEALRAPPT